MTYIEELRALVGHRPLILPGACVLILDRHGHLLMQRRADSGAWGVPGGYAEPGEALEDAARRETLEETGLEVGALTLFDVFSGPGLFHQYPNGDQVWNVTVAYTARDYRGQVLPRDQEGLEVRFFPPDALPDDISPPIKPILSRLAASPPESAPIPPVAVE